MKVLFLLAFSLQLYLANAQQILIPYQSGGKWGLADTTGTVKLIPVYDTIEYEEFTNYSVRNMYFFAVNNKKKGILLNSKLIIPTKFDYIGINQRYIFCSNNISNDKRSIFLYSLTGRQLNALPFADVDQVYYDGDNHIYPASLIKDTKGLFSLGYIDSARGLVLLVKNAYAIKNNRNYLSVQQGEKTAEQNVELVKKVGGGGLELKIKNVLPVEDMADESSNKAPEEQYQNGKYEEFAFIKEDGIWKSLQLKKYIKNEHPFDFTKYDTVYEDKREPFSAIYENTDGITKSYQNMLVSKTAAGYGRLFPDGRSISNSYSSIEGFRTTGGNNFLQYYAGFLFKVKKQGKYGVINQDEQTIIPFDYDTITNDLVVAKANKYGVINIDNSIIIPIAYESVQYEVNQKFYLLQNDKKYGLVLFSTDNNSIVRLDCISPRPITGWKRFRVNYPIYKPYIVFECKEGANHLIGYYDRKGFSYFR